MKRDEFQQGLFSCISQVDKQFIVTTHLNDSIAKRHVDHEQILSQLLLKLTAMLSYIMY